MAEQFTHENTPKSKHNKEIHLLLNFITSPANLGAIFRLADAFGVSCVYLSTQQEFLLESNRFKRMSRSTEKSLKIQLTDEPISLMQKMKSRAFSCLALELTNKSLPVSEINFPDKILLILGAENHGIPNDILSISNHAMHIPIYGNNSSMNVAQATAITLYEIIR